MSVYFVYSCIYFRARHLANSSASNRDRHCWWLQKLLISLIAIVAGKTPFKARPMPTQPVHNFIERHLAGNSSLLHPINNGADAQNWLFVTATVDSRTSGHKLFSDTRHLSHKYTIDCATPRLYYYYYLLMMMMMVTNTYYSVAIATSYESDML